MTGRRQPGQCSIEEHPKGSGRWRVRARRSGRLVVVGSGLSRPEAEETAAAYTELRNAEVLREGVTLSQFGLGFLSRREQRGIRGIAADRNRWKVYVDEMALGALPVSTLRRRDVIDWLDELGARGLAPQTRRNALNLLRVALHDAVDRELLSANPARDVRLPRRVDATAKEDLEGILTPEEQAALLATMPPELSPVVRFALLTGLRKSEQWWLRWEDLHLDEGYVLVRRSAHGKPTKGGRPRRVALLEPARAILETLPRRSPWVFCGARGKRRGHGKDPHGWHAAVEAAGITHRVRWHDLRHTCATSLLAGWWGRKWSLEEVCKLLGHSSVQVTERYARKLDETVRLAVARTEFPSSSPFLALVSADPQLKKAGAAYQTRTDDLRFTNPSPGGEISLKEPGCSRCRSQLGTASAAALPLAGAAQILGILPRDRSEILAMVERLEALGVAS